MTNKSQATVSFAKDILPLFRAIDIAHMKPFGVLLDGYAYMSDGANNHANAQAVYGHLSSHSMPPGGPFWTADQLGLFSGWMNGNYQP
jgi:hypothetical protein